jgi:GntR family transcriptional regulator
MYGRLDDRTIHFAEPWKPQAVTGGSSALLDREAPLPLYVQLRDALLREIRDGGLQPGDRFPSEAAIRDRYRVSRATVRQALADLDAGGVIRKVQGLGSFVAVPKIRHVPLLTSFTELASSQGFTPSHRVLASSAEEVPADAAAELGLADGTRCRFLRRLFLADECGWTGRDVSSRRSRGRRLFDQDRLTRIAVRGPQAAVGLVLDHAVETISPGVVDAPSASLLGCEAGTPVLLIRRLTFTPEGQTVESTRLVFVGDRYEYRVELHRPELGGLR